MNTAAFIQEISGEGSGVFERTIPAEKEKIRWEFCSDIADAAGHYFCTKTNLVSSDEAYGTISYVLNELIENAVKFNCGGKVNISCILKGPELTINVSNILDKVATATFKAVIAKLQSDDPINLLMEQIEANALDPNSGTSGIGLLTLMGDFSADLKWLFSDACENDIVNVNTIATISF